MSKRLVWLGLSLALAALSGCAPEPRNVPCQNAGECEKANADFRHCLDSHCVECIENASCGEGNFCVKGMCERNCDDGRDCPSRQACLGGKCVDK